MDTSSNEPTMRERVSRERREAVIAAMADAQYRCMYDHDCQNYSEAMADAAIVALLPERTAFFDAVDELVDVIKGFESDSTIEDKKIALRDLVYGDDDASGGTR